MGPAPPSVRNNARADRAIRPGPISKGGKKPAPACFAELCYDLPKRSKPDGLDPASHGTYFAGPNPIARTNLACQAYSELALLNPLPLKPRIPGSARGTR